MPQMFNNENTCWGTRKSPGNSNTFDEEATHPRILHDVCNSESNKLCTSLYQTRFNVSTNAYHGYHPHLVPIDNVFTKVADENAMEVEEYENGRFISSELKSNTFSNSIQPNNVKGCNRKRNMSNGNQDFMKKIRKTEATGKEVDLPTHVNYQCGGGDGVWKERRVLASKNEVHSVKTPTNHDCELSQLLKETHGCEFFHYQRTCDY